MKQHATARRRLRTVEPLEQRNLLSFGGAGSGGTAPVAIDDSYRVEADTTLTVSFASPQIAQTGFNDAAGIHGDPIDDSPYALGATVHGRGLVEPGWREGWVVNAGGMEIDPSLGIVEADDPFEGDGVVHLTPSPLWGQTWLYRGLQTPPQGRLMIEQHFRLPDGGDLVSRPGEGGSGDVVAAQWKAEAGRFFAFDGDGLGNGSYEDTGLTWIPNRWTKVIVVIDPGAQTFEFFVDDQPYDAPDPLNFRGNPESIELIDYLTQSHAWLDQICVTSLDPELVMGVLANDTDAEDDPLTATLVSDPAEGTLALDPDGTFTYTPRTGFEGTDSFTYRANDGQLDSNVATVTIHVTARPNTPPVAVDDTYNVEIDTTLSVSNPTQHLAQSGFNDAAGIDWDPIPDSPYEFGASVHGRSMLEAGWAGPWRVDAGGMGDAPRWGIAEAKNPYEGDGSLHVIPSDVPSPEFGETWVYRWLGREQLGSVWVEQCVRLPADGCLVSRPGQGGSGSLVGAQWKADRGGFFAYDGDGHGGGGYEFTGATWVPNRWYKVSTLIDAAAQRYRFFVDDWEYVAPDPLNFRGSPLSIELIDYLAQSDVWLDMVRVTPVDPSWIVGVLANDSDAENDRLEAILVDPPTHGTLSLSPDGTFTYTPSGGYLGDDSFTYRARDGRADSDPATVTIHVTLPLGEPPVAVEDFYEMEPDTTLSVDVASLHLAQSGFNDQAGLHSNPTPHSPYEFGASVHGRSDLEPGWSGGWSVDAGGGGTSPSLATAEPAAAFEGDGVVEIDPHPLATWVFRWLESPQSGPLMIEQYVRLPADGHLISRPGMGGSGGLVAAQWKAEAGTFFVYDGDGFGGGNYESTGFTWTANQWCKVATRIDPTTQKYEFFVDDRPYHAPDPLNFRGSPATVQFIDYLAQSTAWLDQVRVTPLDPSRVVGVLGNDTDAENDPLTAILVDGPSHGTLSLRPDGTFDYTPNPGFVGTEIFTYKAHDRRLDSDPATVTIIVGEPSELLTIDDVELLEGDSGTTGAVFTVRLSGPSTQAVSVEVATRDGTATAGNDYVAQPPASLEFPPGETETTFVVEILGDREIEADETFFVELTNGVGATILDGRGQGTILNDDAPTVVGRHVFYNRSGFDGNHPGANFLDDNAIAADKTALMPGQTATFANYTSYVLGINGVMVDVAGLAGTPTRHDFEFKVGNEDDPGGWSRVAIAPGISVRPGEGDGGSDRVTMIWPNNVIQKQWLQVTVLPGGHTGLAEADVFYFGNAVGESGNSTSDAKVNAYDMLGARDNQRTFVHPAPIDFPFDYDRDARVNAFDMLIARDNQTHFLNALKLITVSGPPPIRWDKTLPHRWDGGQGAAAPAELAARDAVFAEAAAGEFAGRETSHHKLTWLYEFPQPRSPQRPLQNRGVGLAAIGMAWRLAFG